MTDLRIGTSAFTAAGWESAYYRCRERVASDRFMHHDSRRNVFDQQRGCERSNYCAKRIRRLRYALAATVGTVRACFDLRAT